MTKQLTTAAGKKNITIFLQMLLSIREATAMPIPDGQGSSESPNISYSRMRYVDVKRPARAMDHTANPGFGCCANCSLKGKGL